MKIGSTVIVTPLEDPVGYQLDWRRKMVMACITTRLPAQYAGDQDLRAYLVHLRNRARYPLGLADKPKAFDRIDGWQGQETGKLVEAFLLTSAPCPEIARELGFGAEEVRLYGSIHWSVRGADDHPLQGVLARLRAGLRGRDDVEDDLVRLALTAGLNGLRGALGMGTVLPLDALVDQELTRRVMSGTMRTSDLARLQANAIMGRRIELENQDQNAPLRESLDFMQHLMSAFAPRMISVAQTTETIQDSDLAIRARLDSQKLATGVGVTHDARGEKRLDKLMKTV